MKPNTTNEAAERSVSAAYEMLREKLIQTSLRNRMINYKAPTGRTTLGLHIELESSEEIWRLLVCEKKRFGFTGPKDSEPNETLENEEESSPEKLPDNDIADLLLYVNLSKSKREAALLKTYRSALEQMEERGVNTLFLALGMLKWKEPSETGSHLAPLFLVPVQMDRTASGVFKLQYDEGDISTNLSLKLKLEELGVKLPEIPPEVDVSTIVSYFGETRNVIEKQPEWEVLENSIGLNFFSFEKIALYLDLAPGKWASEGSPLVNEDISAALGFGYAPFESELDEKTEIDEVRSVEDSRDVLDADSSQLLVLEEARRGTSMVIEGPPGTGKSQTITNLIAEMMGRGKAVLFVSEKLAALEVVYRKLEQANIANGALELHGSKANRRKFYDEIKRTWALQSSVKDASVNLERLSETRAKLNRYVKELHQPLSPYGISPRRLINIICSLPPSDTFDEESGYDPSPLKDKSWDEFKRLQPFIQMLQARVREIGVPCEHPFWGSSLTFFSPDDKNRASILVGQAIELCAELLTAVNLLATQLSVDVPKTLADIAILQNCVEIAVLAPPLEGVPVRIGRWRESNAAVTDALERLRREQGTRSRFLGIVKANAWEEDWADTKNVVDQRSESFFGRMRGDYKQAASRVRAHLEAGSDTSRTALKAALTAMADVEGERKGILRRSDAMSSLFGKKWELYNSDPDILSGIYDWMLRLEDGAKEGKLPESFATIFSNEFDADNLKRSLSSVEAIKEQLSEKLEAINSLLKVEYLKLSSKTLSDMHATLSLWKDNVGRVSEIVGWNVLMNEIADKGIRSVAHLCSRWPLAAERLENHVLRHWVTPAIRKAYQERQGLQAFERTRQESEIEEFRQLDDKILEHNRARVAHAHLANMPKTGSVGLTAELYRQCELKRGHKSVRWAFEKFGDILLQVKPVCMMSPLSVATYLPPVAGLFDVVIFDEASQVRPEDALSAIARAKQTIVVGDSKQMPPTSFFAAQAADEEIDEEEFDTAVGKMESVLALYSAAVQNSQKRRSLRWHYRSLHQTLIEPSNRLFYEDRLVIFPSPVSGTGGSGSELGLRFHYDPTTTYDRGSQRKVNIRQAEQVANAVREHLEDRGHESLIVVAFSQHQQEAIQDAIEKIVDSNLLTRFNEEHPFERFQVKNLETVQGDERDVVFISVGYGRDISGKLNMNFGPLNKEGGGRRMNVLITRAKKRTEVFTSIRSGDIETEDIGEGGLRSLKVFLQYAETGILEDRRATAEEEDSEFEVQVRAAIESHGFQVDIQVGSAGFKIDLCVRHPFKPGVYVLGIECDGATYHSAKSARDRDKLRQNILESRGWRIHRIWSTDWWQNRPETIERCLNEIRSAIEAYDSDEIRMVQTKAEGISEGESIEIWSNGLTQSSVTGNAYAAWSQPIELMGHELHDFPIDALASYIRRVVGFEGPIHSELLVKRVRDCAGLARAGGRIRDALQRGIAAAVTQNWVSRRGEFLYIPGSPIKARTRELLPSPDYQAEYIAPEEVDDSVVTIINFSQAASKSEITTAVRKFFGYGSMPGALPSMVDASIARLSERGQIKLDGDRFRAS